MWLVTKTNMEFGALLLSLLALVTTFQQQLAVHQLLGTLNEIVSLYYCDYPLNDPVPFLSGLSLVLGSS